MPVLEKLREFLDQHQVEYQVHAHRQAFTAQEVAEAEHVHGREVAKVVMARSGQEFMMLVLPAPCRIALDRARAIVGKPDLELAAEAQFAHLFPGCEPGAMPPFGNLYGMPVWVDRELTHDQHIVFNAGTHTEAVHMRYADFAHLVRPRVAALAEDDEG